MAQLGCCDLGSGDLWRCQAAARWADGVGTSCDHVFAGHYTDDAAIIIDSPFTCAENDEEPASG